MEHQYCPSYVSGTGSLRVLDQDPEGFSVQPVAMPGTFARYSPLRRLAQEFAYGLTAGLRLRRVRPDVVVLCNIPLLAHFVCLLICRVSSVPTVFWQQDVYSHAIATAAERRLGPAGAFVGRVARALEATIAQRSRSVVAIAESFVPVLTAWKVGADRITVIPNWAPLEELPLRNKDNDWAQAHDLQSREVVLYAGTLGLKHDPSLLARIAEFLDDERPEARLVVISEGRGRDYLEEWDRRAGSSTLRLLDYQPYECLPDVLGAADVLVAILEADASRYSVPSKVLSYLCAGRPLLALLPGDNEAAETIRRSGSGLVVDPSTPDAAIDALRTILDDPASQVEFGGAARAFAERTFAIDEVAGRFERVMRSAVLRGGGPRKRALAGRPPGSLSAWVSRGRVGGAQ